MRLLCTLALLVGLASYSWGQTCTISADDNDLTETEIENCLATNGCLSGGSGCTVVIASDCSLSEAVDLTEYGNLTFVIQQAPNGAGGSLTFDNNGSSNKSGQLWLSDNSTLLVEDEGDTSANGGGNDNIAALQGGAVANTGGSPPVLISIGNTNYFESQFDDIISSGGATEIGVLPIELSAFSADIDGNQADLQWRTATELNNDYMVVEHSTDGRRYEEIGRVLGAGTTQEPQDYRFTHEGPAAGLNYYRLRQVDYDGQQEYHGPVTVRLGGVASDLEVYPTATGAELTVAYQGQLHADAMLSVQSLDGRLLRQWAWGSKRSRRTTLNVGDLPSGVYVLRLRNGREVVGRRFLKQ